MKKVLEKNTFTSYFSIFGVLGVYIFAKRYFYGEVSSVQFYQK